MVEVKHTATMTHVEGPEYRRGVRDGIEEALQIAKDQARLMADLAIEGLPENARNREAMEAALTRFSHSLCVTLEALSIPSPSAVEALKAIADLPTPRNLERMAGQEDAYRAVERLFATPPHIEASPSPQPNIDSPPTREEGGRE